MMFKVGDMVTAAKKAVPPFEGVKPITRLFWGEASQQWVFVVGKGSYYYARELRRAEAPADPKRARTLPEDNEARKALPLAEGVLYYFPAALAQVARVSVEGNAKHNPGEPLHHARGKSTDHEDCILRHSLDARESSGDERTVHLANRAWRSLVSLQEHCESLGAPLAPNARLPE